MKFTVTPLGGGRADTARVVDSIVRYLQPRPKAATAQPPGETRGSGPERYYADGGEEPGRWLGRTAHSLGLAGRVERDDFAAMLAGRNPHTGERLITAQGSAGRRPTLGLGAHTRLAPDGEKLFGVADAAVVLDLSHREVERMLDVGSSIAPGTSAAGASGLSGAAPAPPPARSPGESPVAPGPPVRPPARPPARPPVCVLELTGSSAARRIKVREARPSRAAEHRELARRRNSCASTPRSATRRGGLRGVSALPDAAGRPGCRDPWCS